MVTANNRQYIKYTANSAFIYLLTATLYIGRTHAYNHNFNITNIAIKNSDITWLVYAYVDSCQVLQ